MAEVELIQFPVEPVILRQTGEVPWVFARDGEAVEVTAIHSSNGQVDITLSKTPSSVPIPTSDAQPAVQIIGASLNGNTLVLANQPGEVPVDPAGPSTNANGYNVMAYTHLGFGGGGLDPIPQQPQGDTGSALHPPAPILGEAAPTNPPPFPVEGGGGETL